MMSMWTGLPGLQYYENNYNPNPISIFYYSYNTKQRINIHYVIYIILQSLTINGYYFLSVFLYL